MGRLLRCRLCGWITWAPTPNGAYTSLRNHYRRSHPTFSGTLRFSEVEITGADLMALEYLKRSPTFWNILNQALARGPRVP
jgi:hypothetical protein